jgi:hypothetical protein
VSSVSGAIGLAGAAASATDMPNAPSGNSAARALSVRRGVVMGAYDALKEENATNVLTSTSGVSTQCVHYRGARK